MKRTTFPTCDVPFFANIFSHNNNNQNLVSDHIVMPPLTDNEESYHIMTDSSNNLNSLTENKKSSENSNFKLISPPTPMTAKADRTASEFLYRYQYLEDFEIVDKKNKNNKLWKKLAKRIINITRVLSILIFPISIIITASMYGFI